MSFPFVDYLAAELSQWLIEDGSRFNAQYLVSSQTGQLIDKKISSFYNMFQRDLPANDVDEFK